MISNNENSTAPVTSDELVMQRDNNLTDKPSITTMGDPADVVSVSDVDPRAATQQLTGFIDDAAIVPATLPNLKGPAKSLISASQEDRVHTIIDVLSRPVLVASGTWSDSAIQPSLLTSLSFPNSIFDNSTNVTDKLNYFTYLRADVCIRVIVNANTFQAGKLLGYFSPFEALAGNRDTTSQHLAAFTALPHVLIDASTGNVAELRIPYVAPYSSYRLTDAVGTIGQFYLRILNPLRSGTCTYTVYAWFTNISVDLPSGRENALGGQGSQVLRSLRRFLRKGGDPKEFRAQVAGEDAQKSSGVISSTLHTISSVADLATGIPVLSAIAAPVSWISSFAGNVAEYFGFCKPINVSHPCILMNVPGKGYTNANGIDTSVLLANSCENSIDLRGDCFGSAADDMDITTITKHRCFVENFTMSLTDAADTELFSFPVTPGWCRFERGVFQPTLTAYVTSMFELWRGGLKFKIQAAKTAYHSGRIKIIYLPAAEASVVDDPQQAYNWVLDLRNSSEMEFSIPYNNIVEWSTTRLTNGTNISNNFSMGVVRIQVLNELRAPDSVSPTIDFNVWISGESDLQFAIPSFQNYVPSLPDPAELSEFKAQVLGSQQDRGFNDMVDKPKLFEMTTPSKVVPCAATIGEHISNLRVLTRRFSPIGEYAKTTSADLLLEFPVNYFRRVFDPTTENSATYELCPLDYISFIYRFFRGGMRYKAFINSSATTDLAAYQETVLATAFASATAVQPINSFLYNRFAMAASAFAHRVYTLINPILEVTVPYYSQAIIRPIVGTDQDQPTNLISNSVLYKYRSTGTGEVSIYRAGADDFSFGWLVGAPTLRFRNSEANAVEVLLSAITDIEGSGTFVNATCSISPTTPVTPGVYVITNSSPPSLDVVYNDTSTLPGIPTGLDVNTDQTCILRVETNNPTSDVDLAATEAVWAAIGTLSVAIA